MTAPLTIDNPAYFDRLAAVEAAHWWSRAMWTIEAAWLRQALKGRSRLAALDAGCGAGLTLDRLRALPHIETVLGIDPSAPALRHAARHGRPLVRASAERLPFADESFDVVTCFDVLQHVAQAFVSQAASELRRVLRPGGIVLVRGNGRGLGSGKPSAGYRLADLSSLMASAGLTIRRASYANCLPALAQELRGRVSLAHGRNARVSPRPRPHPAGGGLQIRVPGRVHNAVMGVVAGAEAALPARCGIRLPFGHSTLVLAERCC